MKKKTKNNRLFTVLKIAGICLSVSLNASYAKEKDFVFVIDKSIKKSVFNPHPMKDDLVLPLPCGSEKYNIVFRKIYTNDLSDSDMTNGYPFFDGSEDPLNAAIQSKRKCNVRGNFSDSKGNFFYLSKYELTKGQYEAIVLNKCKSTPSVKDAVAMSNISIDEARNVAKIYSDFLQKSDKTPKVQNEKAYASLPYECYWSFAQRGGLSVNKNSLEDDTRLADPSKTVKDYAWGYGPDSSNGKVQVIGMKLPSDLGLFDMLGNVQEYMDEPFQATVQGDLLAQKGGSTVRGGSILTPFSLMTNSLRTEKKRYTNGNPTKAEDTGMRLMLNVSVTLDRETLKKLESDVIKKNASRKTMIKQDDEQKNTSNLAFSVKENAFDANKKQKDTDNYRYISPYKAAVYIGQFKKVCGFVYQVKVKNNQGYLNFGGRYPNQKFVVYINKMYKYGNIYDYSGKKVCVSGTIKSYRSMPEIINPYTLELQN